MNRTAQLLRMLCTASLLALALVALGCTGEREKISFEQFSEYVRTDKVAEVTVLKPANPESEPAKVEGRYRRSIEGTTATLFETEGKIDEAMIAQMKASGVIINYKE